MSLLDIKNKEELKQRFAEIDELMEEEDNYLAKRRYLGWLTSAAIHALVLLVFTSIIYVNVEKEKETPPVRVSMIEPPQQINTEKLKDIIESKISIDIDNIITEKITETVSTDINIPEENTNINDPDAITSFKKGREEAVSDIECGGTGAFMIIGAGNSGSGIFGNRRGDGKRIVKNHMGIHGKGTDSSIDAALRWLNKHQSPDGGWDAIKYYINCTDGLKCEPGVGSVGNANVAMTGYSILCYLGVGYDHKTPSKYRKQVAGGINYLVRIQKPDGLLGERNYEHAIASMALFEAYAMTTDISLAEPCKKAVRVLLDRQSQNIESKNSSYNNGLGWDYVNPNPNRIDFSVSGWCIMALKSAMAAGLDVKSSMKDFDKLIISTWQTSNSNWKNITPYDRSIFPYSINPTTSKVEKDHLSFVGGLCSVFLGHRAGDNMLDSLVNDSKVRWLDNKMYRRNLYALYYGSLLSFQTQTTWKDWREEYVPYLISTQIKSDNCLDGTWKFDNQSFHGADTSQILRHTYSLLALEVAYRYVSIGGGIKIH